MNYLYPPDLVERTKSDWQHYLKTHDLPEPIVHFPNDDELLTMLHIMYHLSFAKEEARPSTAKVTYLNPHELSSVLSDTKAPTFFDHPIPFTKSEIKRLCPAFDPEKSILAICAQKHVSQTNSDELVVWGVLPVENTFSRIKDEMLSLVAPSAHLFTLSVFEPGELIASAGSEELYRLSGGQLVKYPARTISEGIIGQHFEEVLTELFIAGKGSRNLAKKVYFRTLSNMLKLIEKERHGGTLIIVPSTFTADPHALDMKYELRGPAIWPKLVNTVEHLNWLHKMKAMPEMSQLTKTLASDFSTYLGQQQPMNMVDKVFHVKEANERIAEHEHFIASLSEVDGAVVMNDHLEVLGFGTEIRLTNDKLSSIKQALSPHARESRVLKITSYGTRHRSAIRYAKYNPAAIVFVISQDGRVKAVKQHEGITYLWDGIRLT